MTPARSAPRPPVSSAAGVIPMDAIDRVGAKVDVQPLPRSVDRWSACLWFLVLAALYGRVIVALVRHVAATGGAFLDWVPILSRSCALIFMVTLGWLMLTRLPAIPTRTGALPRLIALTGTYGVWLAPFLPARQPPPMVMAASACLSLSGGVLVVASIAFLGRSFSIAPQARRLVIDGPYRLVRHPLYLAEELALLGILLQCAWYAAAPFLLLHMALQIRRMVYEEAVLRDAFPGYVEYAARTARLIPGVW